MKLCKPILSLLAAAVLLDARVSAAQAPLSGAVEGELAADRSGPAMAAERAALTPSSVDDFGVGNVNVLQIHASGFLPTQNTMTYDAGFYFSSGTVSALFAWAPVQLPTGSKILNIGLYYDDTDPTPGNNISATLYAFPGFNASASNTVLAAASSSGSGGKGYAASPTIAYTVNNSVHAGGGAQLAVLVYAPGGTKFKAIDVVWTRQLSPPPGSATFADVPPNDPFFAAVEAFARAGITGGCAPGNFCPNGVVTRAQLAKFLARALGLYWPDVGP